MNKKILIIIMALAVLLLGGVFLITNGVITIPDNIFATFSGETTEEEKLPENVISTVDALIDNRFYIWHDDKKKSITEVLLEPNNTTSFTMLPAGELNTELEEDDDIAEAIWFTSDNDNTIPTLFPGDELIYVSDTNIPYEGIRWNRYEDNGYSLGIIHMQADAGGKHYYISLDDTENPYSNYIYQNSDATELKIFTNVEVLMLDKIGGNRLETDALTHGGVIKGLEKDKTYLCEWYTGTYYQDFNMTSNIRPFTFLESFQTYDYTFLHSNCISIQMPEYLKTGYYYINNIGLFRYISADDIEKYNNLPYCDEINFNDPIIIKDKNGDILYDPTNPEGVIDNRYNGESDEGLSEDMYEYQEDQTAEQYEGSTDFESIENTEESEENGNE